MADAARIFEEALTLPTDERARLAHELIHSLEPDDPDASVAWSEEIRKRIGSRRRRSPGPSVPTTRERGVTCLRSFRIPSCTSFVVKTRSSWRPSRMGGGDRGIGSRGR